MRKNIVLPVLFVFSVLLLSCNRSQSPLGTYDTEASEESVPIEKTALLSSGEEYETFLYERQLTRNGTVRFETDNTDKTRKNIQEAVSETKGYISSDNSDEQLNRKESTVIIRVPADNFDALLAKITSGAKKIDYKNIEVLDVTQEYIDLDTRIKTKKELEERYRELLKRANTVEEILKIEEQIGILRADIESTEGRLRYLSSQIRYSTLHVTFYKKSSDFRFAGKMGKAFRNGWNNLLWLLVGITNLWAILLFGVLLFGAVTYIVRRRRRRKL